MDSPPEFLGFVSFEGKTAIPPTMIHLDFEEVAKIQNGIPLDWAKENGAAKWTVFVDPLEEYLTDNNLLNSDNNGKEFSIICRSSILSRLFYYHNISKSESKFERKGNIILIEEVMSDEDKILAVQDNRIEQAMGYVAELELVKLPTGEKLKVKGAKELYIMTKKRFSYSDGTIINLFISTEIDAVYEKGTDLIPLDLKLFCPKPAANQDIFASRFKKAIYADYITGGITFLLGLHKDRNATPEKITIVENISSICFSEYLKQFKPKLSEFLIQLTQLKSANGIILKKVLYHKFDDHDIKVTFKYGKLESKLLCRSSFKSTGVNNNIYDSAEHELIILGSYKAPLDREKFLNTDFIKIEHFKKGFYKEIMVKPDKILFFGNMNEYAQVLRFMSNEQLAITSRVVGSSD